MANIRVDLDHELNNGQPVTFVAPCDCTAVTGLKVYHLGGSKVFTFKDAHGNTLTGIGNLFESGAIVKALLDTTNGYAYLQNADTNKYIEDTFLKKAGGTMTGALTTTEVNVADDSWPMVNLRNAAGKKLGMVSVDTSSNRLCLGQQETGASYYEGYQLPARTNGLTASKFYTILTTKNATDYVVAQGTSGGWYYQKWNSKYVTAWRNVTTTPTVQGVNYVTQALPFTLANTNYYVGVTGVSTAMSGFATDFNVSNSTPSEGRTTTNVTINYNYSRSNFYSVGMTVFIMGVLP